MINPNKLVPKLRFPGFTENWEQRKLGDVVSLRGRIGFRGYTQADLVGKGNGAITFSPGDIDDAGNVSQENNKYISWAKYEESPEIKIQPGDILFTKTASIGKVGFVRELKEKATINPQFALLTPLDGTDGYFTFLAVRTEGFMKQVRDITGGSSVPTMSQEKLKELTFMVPSLGEQNKLGVFFKQLDDTITLHQRKLDEMKQFKSGMLQKMFPRDGKKVPEVRFPGFAGNWEQRKLSALMDFSNGFNGGSELYGKGIPFISVIDILNNDYITYECIRGKVDIDGNTLKRFSVHYGDVLFQRSSENVADAGSSNVYLGDKTAAFGGFVIRGKKKSEYDGYFMKALLDSSFVRKQIISKAQGAQHINISQETLSDIEINMPSMAEQVSIGQFISAINRTISLHQHKLDAMKELKKGLLQQMFV